MILTTLHHADAYAPIHPGLADGFAFLRRPDLHTLPEGKIEIDGARIVAIIARADGRRPEEGLLEGHRKYIDIQYVIQGDESMGWRSTQDLTVATAYDPEKDLLFFKERPASTVLVPPGSLTVFFPDDAHLPLIGTGPIHKVIIKIAV